MQRLRYMLAMCKALAKADAEARQCITRLHLFKACLRLTGLSMLTDRLTHESGDLHFGESNASNNTCWSNYLLD